MMYEVQYNIQQLPSIILSVVDGKPPKDISSSSGPGNTGQGQKYGSIEISIASIVQSPDCILSGKRTLIGGSHAHNAKLEYLCALHGVVKSRGSDDASMPEVVGMSGSDGNKVGNSLPTDTATNTSTTTSSQFIKVTIIKGRGFQIEKRALKLDDIPDVYCTIQLGSNPTVWTTSTVKNSTTPTWNESHTFFITNHVAISSIILQVNVYDQDTGKFDIDDELGTVRVPVTKILLSPNQTYDCELTHNGKLTNSFISIQCEKVLKSNLE
jgi:hypothetical protein